MRKNITRATGKMNSDKGKWFICVNSFITYDMRVVPVGEWQCCVHDKLSYSMKRNWRRATKKEIEAKFGKGK